MYVVSEHRCGGGTVGCYTVPTKCVGSDIRMISGAGVDGSPLIQVPRRLSLILAET